MITIDRNTQMSTTSSQNSGPTRSPNTYQPIWSPAISTGPCHLRQTHGCTKSVDSRSIEIAVRTGSRQFMFSQRGRYCRARENRVPLDTFI
jgi:hypothetical protein